nr:MAG TPA: hypothetical protein [Caudoviricetes sp.]
MFLIWFVLYYLLTIYYIFNNLILQQLAYTLCCLLTIYYNSFK